MSRGRQNTDAARPLGREMTAQGIGAPAVDNSSQETLRSQIPQARAPRVPRRLFALGRNHAKFNNPFHGCDDEEVRHIAQRVAQEYSLGDQQDLFIKAAMVLKNPDPRHWRNFRLPLDAKEKTALENERKASFWDQPWPLQTTFLMLFVAAMVQGWSQTGTNGANLGLPGAFGWITQSADAASGAGKSNSGTNQNCIPKGNDGWIFGAVNAAPYLTAGVACWFSDYLNELVYGRRGAIAISALFVFASSIGAAFTKDHWGLLFLCRALLGVGMGCKAAVVPVFAAEIAPAHLRGTLVMNWQVFDALGIFFGFTANIIASKADPAAAWRWQVASSCIPAFALLWGTLYICWDSPRFLMKKERKSKAKYDRVATLWSQEVKRQDEKHQQNQAEQNQYRNRENQDHERTADEGTHDQRAQDRPYDSYVVVPKWLYRSRLLPPSIRQFFRPSIIKPYISPAFKTLVLLRGYEILAAKELLFAHCQLMIELQENESEPNVSNLNEDIDFALKSSTNWLSRVWHLFASRKSRFVYIRREAMAAGCVMLSQQLCGINVLIFYSATLFCGAGSGRKLDPLLLSWGIGGVNFLFAFPAYKWIESRGRQWLLLATLPLLAITMGVAALGFGLYSHEESREQEKIVVFLFAFVFTAIYSFGLGPVPFTYSAEIFPLEHRMVGMSFAVSVNMLGAGALALFVPKVNESWILLTIFFGLNLVAFWVVWRYVREVSGAVINDTRTHMTALDLEQLFYIFRLPNWVHKGYQSEVFFDYFWRSIGNILMGRKKPDLDQKFYVWGHKTWNAALQQQNAAQQRHHAALQQPVEMQHIATSTGRQHE